MFIYLYLRAVTSYELAIEAYSKRVASQIQPTTSPIDVYDADVQEKLLVTSSLFYVAITSLLYVHMKKRTEPYKVKGILLAYNITNVTLSLYISTMIVLIKLQGVPGPEDLGEYSAYTDSGVVKRWSWGLICNPLDNSPRGERLASVFVLFYAQKFLEFGDTFFFLLRRSFRQVTFLHLFHHSSIAVLVGSVLPFAYNDDMFLPILLNSSTHVLLYFHYILTSLGIQAWWSPYLTGVQLGQFVLIFVHSLVALGEGPSCGSPDFIKELLLLYMGSMILLFGVFFTQRYILKIDQADMCGVIKSMDSGPGGATTWHGNARLQEKGEAVVRLPRGFHDTHENVLYCYHLTPIGAPMPSLHVSSGVTRGLHGHKFSVGGGEPNGLISWQVAIVHVLDRVPH